jgi:hypothetical protein
MTGIGEQLLEVGWNRLVVGTLMDDGFTNMAKSLFFSSFVNFLVLRLSIVTCFTGAAGTFSCPCIITLSMGSEKRLGNETS